MSVVWTCKDVNMWNKPLAIEKLFSNTQICKLLIISVIKTIGMKKWDEVRVQVRRKEDPSLKLEESQHIMTGRKEWTYKEKERWLEGWEKKHRSVEENALTRQKDWKGHVILWGKVRFNVKNYSLVWVTGRLLKRKH